MGKKEDIAWQKYGLLTFVRFHKIINKKTYWVSICDCGKEAIVRIDAVKQGRVISCGCVRHKRGKNCINLTGMSFGKLTVIKISSSHNPKSLLWDCQCGCGKTIKVQGNSLRTGHTKSCGCFHKETAANQAYKMGKSNTTHGMSRTQEYETWHHMKQRCYDKNQRSYKEYGGRGIRVCSRWKTSFENFFADMGPKPSPSHTIERKNTNKHYSPKNCIWASWKEQQRNRRNNIMITHKEKTQCISAWAEEYGLTTAQLWRRIRGKNSKWDFEEALTTPVTFRNGPRKRYEKNKSSQ